MDHVERELSRDRSQHQASELLANLPEPQGGPVGHNAADLLDQLPEPDTPRACSSLADDLLAELPDPVGVEFADDVADITARLDRLQQRQPPAVDDGVGIDLW